MKPYFPDSQLLIPKPQCLLGIEDKWAYGKQPEQVLHALDSVAELSLTLTTYLQSPGLEAPT